MKDDSDYLQNTMTGEKVVVTGMSGIFPNSDSVQEFMDNLFNKVDMVSVDTRWNTTDPEQPKHSGRVRGIDKFDAQFFKVGFSLASTMEPMSRKILEHAYGAIFDSGNTHVSLKGKIVGVFIGSSYADHCTHIMFDTTRAYQSIVNGTSKAMLANRVSYWLDGKGPSYNVDYSCASSSVALENAFKSLKAGDCDAAVVGGCNLCSNPSLTLNMKRAGLLCLDGKTKCFDENGDGYVRSDAVSVIFLQKASDAKRVYAEVYHAEGAYQLKSNNRFLPLRKSEELQKFFNDIYSKTDVEPKEVEYVEANGAALAEADGNEAEAIANVFSVEKAVKLGSVKSNMGHSEPASGLCSLTKLCLAYHKGEIPANLHLQEPVQSVQDGQVQVVTENTPFNRGYTALNNMSLTGANFHVILKGHYKKKNLDKYKSNVPRIVLASGRQESAVSRIFDALKSKQVDAEEIALLHNIFENDIVGHMGRGYTILDTIKESTVALSESVDYYPGVKPPLWFVYSGMGSQWAGMGADLMRIPTFAAAIERCHKVLVPKGIDLVKVITDPNNKFVNIIESFVGIGAIQIGLTDILKEMGVVPDYIIGHSLGENSCAYHDDTITAEQTILSAYSRGKAIQDSKLIKGLMAAVGLGHKELVKQCPPEIDIGCHNSSDSSTISGPADVMEEFVAELTKRGIFARTVASGNIAYHSRYVANAGPTLLRYLEDVIKDPKPRSDKWLSTSVPREQWNEPAAKYSSAKYHTNNLLSPVLFEEIISLIPKNAVVVEIAPYGLLQAILKRSHKNCTHIPLASRGNTEGVKFLLEAIGKLYQAGFNPKVEVLYPKVEFPVSTETPLLSHLVEWEHSEDWSLTTYKKNKHITSASRKIVFSLHDDDYKYLEGYTRNGVNVLPEAALLVFVWETLAMYQGIDFRELSVIFKDIQFHGEIIVEAETLVRLTVMISKGTNTFEVTHEDNRIVSGVINEIRKLRFQDQIDEQDEPADEFETDINLNAKDIYRILKMRGFEYREDFQSIFSSNVNRTKALIKWTDHWVPFLDSLIQLNSVSRDYNGISKPKFIRVLSISALEQENGLYEIVNGLICYPAQINKTYGNTRCAGVNIEDITYTDILMEENTAGALESQKFCPYYPTEEVNMNTAIEMNLQIITENSKSKDILITKFVADTVSEEFDYIDRVVDKLLLFNTEIKTFKIDNDASLAANYDYDNHDKTNVIILENLLQNSKIMKDFQNISIDTFILSIEDKVPRTQSVKDFFIIISCMSDGKKIQVLMKRLNHNNMDTSFIPIRFDDTFSWVPDVYSKLLTTKRVVLISDRQPYCGVLGLIKQLKATGHNNVSVVIVDDFNAPKFDPHKELYKNQLQKNMTINIMRKGQWGTFYLKSSKMLQYQKSFELKNFVPGNLEKISWVEAPKINGDKILAQVCYSGLSINECHNIVGINKNGCSLLGMDFSGIDRQGEKVMGLIHGGSAASTVEADPDLLWPVPDDWNLEDAATVPLAYAQAYYCLLIRSQFRKGTRVLICDGTNSVGLALISLCLSYNCTVFTVVNSEERKKILVRLYPQLEENNIICSDNDGFSSIFLSNNKGQKCDYVINFATGPCREVATKCVAPSGVFMDFSKHDMHENESIGMSFLVEEKTYMAVNILNIFKPEYSTEKKVLQKLIKQGIECGAVKPLIRVTFPPLHVAKALRVLSLNQHIGKVLIRVRDPSIVSNGLETIPRVSYSPQDVLIIVCDEKGVGIELIDRLIERGARKIVLHVTKTSSVTGYIHTKLLTWSKQEVLIKLVSDNLQNEKGSTTFIKNAIKFGKVKGVFVVLDTKHTDNGMKEDFVNAFNKQSLVVMNLDVASRNCADLSHFVVLSRFAQSASDENSLSLTERVCDKRNEMGFPTLIVRYESLAEMDGESTTNKTKPQTLSAVFNAIETSLRLKHTNVLTYNLKKKEKEDITDKDKEQDGMFMFFKHLDTDVDNVTAQTIVELPTLLNNGTATDWDPKDSYVILVPGFEGRPQIFEAAAERLKMRSVAIQLGPDLEGESIEEIAENARKEIRRRFLDCDGDVKEIQDRKERERRDKRFFIVGYSFGVNIALELAAILEREGKTGVVHCIDSSPDALRATLETVLGHVTEDQVQNHVLNHMFNLITGKKGKELKVDLKAIPTFNAKVEECLRRMKGVVSYSDQYKRQVLESAYGRIVMAQQYNPELRLRSQLVLMKSSRHIMAGKLPDDYNLSKYSQKPVKVYPLVAGDPDTAPYDPRVSNIVNLFLDAEYKDQFNKLNLCDVYTAEIDD